MGAAGTTGATGVSRERLNQIAHRKLSSLGIGVQLAADGQTLQGGLRFAALKHPMSSAPIPGSRFVVVGHDKLQFLDPPLCGLPPIDYFDLDRAAAIEDRLGLAFRVRLGYLRDAAGRMAALKLVARADPDRLVAVAEVRTVSHSFELVGGPDGIRVGRVGTPSGKGFAVSESFPPLRLEEFQSLTDLELFLSDAVAQMPPAGAPPSAAPKAQPARLLPVPPGPGTLGFSLLQRFGPEASLAVGPNGRLEVSQDFDLGGTRLRFTAAHEGGPLFRGQLASNQGVRWADRIDLNRFPGILELVATVLEIDLNPPPQSSGDPEAQPPAAVGHQLAPQAGEVWVMNVLVERDDGAEVRYACLDVNGQPYGAARVLPRSEFETAFARQGAGWKLLILLDHVQGQTVIYRQLDSGRQARGEPKTLRIDHLVSSFVPEASDY